jgi:hypothetical protein
MPQTWKGAYATSRSRWMASCSWLQGAGETGRIVRRLRVLVLLSSIGRAVKRPSKPEAEAPAPTENLMQKPLQL